MNKIIDIQKITQTQDSYGQPVETWVNAPGLTGLFASIVNTGGREFYAAQRMNAEITAVFKLRYVDGITPQMRVKYNGRYFPITFVNNVNEGDNFLLLYCKEVI